MKNLNEEIDRIKNLFNHKVGIIKEVEESTTATIKVGEDKKVTVKVQGGWIYVGEGNSKSVVKVVPKNNDSFCMGINSVGSESNKLILYPNVPWYAPKEYSKITLGKDQTNSLIEKMNKSGENFYRIDKEEATIYITSKKDTIEKCKKEWS